jgi:teichuronic acid biosynthesis glycosyltransferase TuaC
MTIGDSTRTGGRRLRILSLSTAFPNPAEPGLGTFVRSRLRHMASRVEIKVVAPLAIFDYAAWWAGVSPESSSVPRQRWDGELEVLHPRWLYPPGAGALTSFFLLASLLPNIRVLRRRYRFDLIDAHFGHPTAVVAASLAALFGCPFLVTLRGAETRHAGYALRRYWMSWALRRASRVIAVSDRLREFAISLGVAPDRACTIPNGVDTRIFFRHERAAVRSRHGIPLDQVMLLSAGNLIEGKGHHRVIEALATLRSEGIPAGLWIAGCAGREGRYEEAIRNLVRKLDLDQHVRFLGHLTAPVLAEYMSAANVFCLASTREGWPNVVHESLACGTPVVASDVGGVPDLIPAAEYGIIVPAADQPALESALRVALHKKWDYKAIGGWGQSRSWEKVANEVVGQAEQGMAEYERFRETKSEVRF